MKLELTCNEVSLRPFIAGDAKRLALLINNKKIFQNLRDFIPNPYTESDGENFISYCSSQHPVVTFGIEYKGVLVGCIGVVPQEDVYRLSAELGYWIGEEYWNHGIATTAVNLIVGYAFSMLKVVRVYSSVFEHNKASQKVLDKAGFKLEAIFEKAVVKNGELYNEYRYAKLAV